MLVVTREGEGKGNVDLLKYPVNIFYQVLVLADKCVIHLTRVTQVSDGSEVNVGQSFRIRVIGQELNELRELDVVAEVERVLGRFVGRPIAADYFSADDFLKIVVPLTRIVAQTVVIS